jgi:hypothetical protein
MMKKNKRIRISGRMTYLNPQQKVAPYSSQTSGVHLLNELVLRSKSKPIEKVIRKNLTRREKSGLEK